MAFAASLKIELRDLCGNPRSLRVVAQKTQKNSIFGETCDGCWMRVPKHLLPIRDRFLKERHRVRVSALASKQFAISHKALRCLGVRGSQSFAA